ncbi:hypothetical protein AALP_AA3G152500 [Arabis alpina]|uniref:Pentacotripeptide-repeat region of PRORP domain-containing protein n=1 Tax=Arabis alpina TaxID=50452 RepID=A0A087H9C4_ARAAL|nr:hypothetical protein AALP_AA3G152500 [Arabis alpina]
MPERNVVSWTAMISRYSQIGHSLEEALTVFAEMMRSDGKPNEFTFAYVLTSCVRASGLRPCSLLDMYAKAGLDEKALEMFQRLQSEGMSPNYVTHGRMEDTGLSIFDGMIAGDYGIKPDTEHYGCIVDMLGRAGRIEEAFEFVKSMPSEPTAGVLGSLLGRWEEVNNLRALMIQKAVTKEPGRSWIQHEQTLNYFHANDRTHPRREEVAEGEDATWPQ